MFEGEKRYVCLYGPLFNNLPSTAKWVWCPINQKALNSNTQNLIWFHRWFGICSANQYAVQYLDFVLVWNLCFWTTLKYRPNQDRIFSPINIAITRESPKCLAVDCVCLKNNFQFGNLHRPIAFILYQCTYRKINLSFVLAACCIYDDSLRPLG